MRDDLGKTKITQGGLLALCRLKLKYLNIRKVICDIESNGYGDKGALTVARQLPSLEEL